MNFLKTVVLGAVLGAAVLLAGCTSASEAYCARKAECELKECDGTEDACEELAIGDEESCIAEQEAWLEAVRTGEGAICGECADAVEEASDCLAEIESCDKFEEGTTADGECASEANKAEDACEDVGSDCLGYAK